MQTAHSKRGLNEVQTGQALCPVYIVSDDMIDVSYDVIYGGCGGFVCGRAGTGLGRKDEITLRSILSVKRKKLWPMYARHRQHKQPRQMDLSFSGSAHTSLPLLDLHDAVSRLSDLAW